MRTKRDTGFALSRSPEPGSQSGIRGITRHYGGDEMIQEAFTGIWAIPAPAFGYFK